MNPFDALKTALGDGPLTEDTLRAHVDPLFCRALSRPGVYLANHSLGRPLDRTAEDVQEGLDAWYLGLGDAWGPWLATQDRVRAGLAALLGAPRADCVVPKTSAGQGLRAILNLADHPLRVLSTRGEFDSIDVILRHYRDRGRIDLRLVAPRDDGRFAAEDLLTALDDPTDLVVISQVMFTTGQRISALPAIIQRAHDVGARVLVDTYHAVGVFSVDLVAMDVDYAIGGAYKYLRGGPGACWLYVRPDLIDHIGVPLDTGWFAKESPFTYQRPDPPRFAGGGNRFLESTPPVLTPYQALAGLEFTLAVGVPRIRAWGLDIGARLRDALAGEGVVAEGANDDSGAFVVVRHPDAPFLADRLAERGIDVDARGDRLRLTADVLTRAEELPKAARAVAEGIRSLG